jgi:2-oxoglutarate ferredoxin oxidoreductase subunit beta
MPGLFDPWIRDPERMLLLDHPSGVRVGPELARTYRNRIEHDPSDLKAARDIAASPDPIPVGILYRDESVPRYEELRGAGRTRTTDDVRRGLEAELDRFAISAESVP